MLVVLVTTTVLNTKIGEVENKIPSVSDNEPKYFTTSDYNKLESKIPEAKIKKQLVDKSKHANSPKSGR